LIVVIAILWYRYAATQKLIRALDSKDLTVRAQAARKLLDRRVLEDALPAQPVARRAHTAVALGLVGTKPAMEQLVVLIKDPEDWPQRRAAQALGSLGPKAMPYLVVKVFKDGDARAKKAAVQAARLIGVAAVPALRKALSSADHREQASIALAEVAKRYTSAARRAKAETEKEAALKAHARAIAPLLRAAQGKDAGLRKLAIAALGDAREKTAVPLAVAELAVPGNARTAIISLGLIADTRATMPLLPFLKDPKLRIDTAASLGEIGDVRAAGALLTELSDPEQQFRSRAIWALQCIGQPAVPQLLQALRSPDVYVAKPMGAATPAESLGVARAAAQAFEAIPSVQAVPALVAAIGSSDGKVRASAAQALGWQGNQAAIPALIAALGHSDWRVVDGAIDSLAAIGKPAVDDLMKVMQSSPTTIAYNASRALARMVVVGAASPVDTLIQALGSSSSQLRKWAAITLGNIGDARATDPLQRLYRSSAAGSDERWVAREALLKLRAMPGA
jgi:HEAT repeat protein